MFKNEAIYFKITYKSVGTRNENQKNFEPNYNENTMY